jgi:AAA domain
MANPERLYPENAAPPWDLYHDAACEYRRWSRLVAKGGHLMLPWNAVHALVGPLLPGWLVVIGARAKGGKSTFLRHVLDAWVSHFHRRVLYVGTEQSAGILRALWSCIRLRVPTEAAIDPGHPDHQRVLDDLPKQGDLADQAIIVAEQSITVETFTQWARVAYKEKCDVLMFDHFHRLEAGSGEGWRERNNAVQRIKTIASKSNMVTVIAAQLRNGPDDALGQYEVPGPQSWAETAGLRRECDVAVQLWRPFVRGVTRQQKSEAKDDVARMAEIVQPNVMAVRCDAHRYRQADPAAAARLYVDQGELQSWSGA